MRFAVGLWSPLWYPLQTLVNQGIGLIGCYILFMAGMSIKHQAYSGAVACLVGVFLVGGAGS